MMKNNLLLSIIEIFCPVLLMFIFLCFRLSFKAETKTFNSLYINDEHFINKYSTNLTDKVTSDNYKSIIDEKTESKFSLPYNFTLAQCQKNSHIALIGNVPDTFLKHFYLHAWELNNSDIKVEDIFKKYDSKEKFYDYIKSSKYGTNNNSYPKFCFGISYNKDYEFEIHYSTADGNTKTDNVDNMLKNRVPIIPNSKLNKNEKVRTQEDTGSFENYIQSGYLMVMKMIYDYTLQKITGKGDAEINFSVVGMKFDSLKEDSFHSFLYLIGFFIIISYAVPLSINVYREIYLKETKQKELMIIMGLKESVLILTYYIRYFMVNLIHSIFCSLFAFLSLKQFEWIYIFGIFFLYGLVIMSMTYFFQSFQEKSRLGVIISLIIYCVMTFIYSPIKSPAASSFWANFFCILLPPVNLLLGFNTILVFEKQFSKFNGRTHLDVDKITISQMYLYFILNFLIYILLGICTTIFSKSLFKFKKKHFTETEENIDIDVDINNSNKGDNNKNSTPNNAKKLKVNFYESVKGQCYIKQIEKYNKEQMKENEGKNELLEGELEGSNFILNDDQEIDLDFQIEAQKIRNKRGEVAGGAMYNFNSEESIINQISLHDINSINQYEGSFISDNQSIFELEESKIEILEESEIKNNYCELHLGDKLEVKNLTKIYEDGTKALNNLSFTLCENEIFILLGQNGAGKSTFTSILTGLQKKTKGEIIFKTLIKDEVKNKNLKEIKKNNYDCKNIFDPGEFNSFRKVLGLCPQMNILFDELTVKQHLEMYSSFKGKENCNKNIEELLADFGLKEKENFLSKNLSGGQKRKLSIAIACCVGSKIIILDEPTGGMDVTARRELWLILKKYKKNRIIILITHFMDEAAFLGDQVCILKEGKYVCLDTPKNLIKEFGQNITFKLNKNKGAKDDEIIKYIKNILEEYSKNDSSYSQQTGINSSNENSKTINITGISDKIEENGINNKGEKNNKKIINIEEEIEIKIYNEEIKIRIPKNLFNFQKTKEFLDKLESGKEQYKIKNYILSMDSLEDVFLNVMRKNESKKKNKSKNDYLYSKIYKPRGIKKFKNELIISFKKRALQIIHDKKALILELLFPIILTFIACLVSYIEFLEENITFPISLAQIKNDHQKIFYDVNKKISNLEEDILYKNNTYISEDINNFTFSKLELNIKRSENQKQNIINYLNLLYEKNKNENIKDNFGAYYITNFDTDNHKYEFVTFVNTLSRQSIIAYPNYLLKNIIIYELEKYNKRSYFMKDMSIGVNHSPFPLTHETKSNKKERNGFTIIFFISIALSLIPANFITTILREKENKSKHLQIISGLSLFSYWFNNFIFELIKYYAVVGLCILFLSFFSFYEDYLYILYFEYGPALIAFTYIISLLVEKEGTGQVVILIINLIFGALCGSAVLILRTDTDMKYLGIPLSYVLRIIPSFCMSYGYNQLLSRKMLLKTDYYSTDEENSIDILNEKYNDSKTILKDKNYLIADIIYLLIETIIYILLIFIIEDKKKIKSYFHKNKNKINEINENNEIENEEIDERYEKNDEEMNNNNNNKKDYSELRKKNKTKVKKEYINIYNVQKEYKNFICFKNKKTKALKGISFSVDKGECFGFLGTNGAGKSTAFKCLSYEISPTNGQIFIGGKNATEDHLKRYSIGYCPQFDAIFEFLTVYENLEFYGLLKGILKDIINDFIEDLLTEMDLIKFKDQYGGNLSGGNKRKLSVAIAIICNPDLVLMDEPSTGMDPDTRKFLLNIIDKVCFKITNDKKSNYSSKNGSAIIMTTHSIEEAESLCHKIGILTNGKFACKGTISKILEEKGKGITINIEFIKPFPQDLVKTYGKHFESSATKINSEFLNKKCFSLDDISIVLRMIEKTKYIKFLKNDHLGRDIIEIMGRKKGINNYSVLRWTYYMDNLTGLTEKIKENFFIVNCTDFHINNFILNVPKTKSRNALVIKEPKSESYIFGILEKYKNDYHINEYQCKLTTLEEVFFNLSSDKKNIDTNRLQQGIAM